jgi:hypothetical protein
MNQFHFKKFRSQLQHIIDEYTKVWQSGLPQYGGDFYAAAQDYFHQMSEHFHDSKNKWSSLELSVRSNLIIYPVFESILRRCPTKFSYTALTAMPEFSWLVRFLTVTISGGDSSVASVFVENLMTVFMLWFMDHNIRLCGDKAYVVKPDLRWALENTELKGFPSDDLRLPFPAVYIDVEGLIDVYNPVTGQHKSLGVYITEDQARTPRAWRILVVGKGKIDSEFGPEYDDALYHFQILFPEGSTVDDALQHTFSFLTKEQEQREVEVEFDGRMIKIETGFGTDDNKERFVKMWQNLVHLFKYLMNVVVYSTTQDADVQFRATSPAYAALQDRAMKAAGEKRRRLFDQLKHIAPDKAFVLGGNVVIDRHPKEASSVVEENERRKQRVRSLVSGHYHTYRIGTGRIDSIRKWLSPYWRGPEHAPLTTKTRVVK